jgi:cytochrome b involved in lipid metabolism
MSIEFTWNEIYSSENQNWIVANNNVYDITELLDIHPGGKQCLINHIKKDCTIDYNFHSKDSKKEWKKYKIGYIKKNEHAYLKKNESCIIL